MQVFTAALSKSTKTSADRSACPAEFLPAAGATVVRNVRIAGNSLGSRDWTANATLTTNSWFTGFGAAGKWENIVSCGARLSYDLGVYLANHNSSFKNLQVGL